MGHQQAVQATASGIHGVPEAGPSFAATMAAFRFLHNPRVSLRSLAQPLIETARQEALTGCDRYLLVVHDWTQLMYPDHSEKKDRIMLSNKHVPEGYKLQTALLVSDRQGLPLAPAVLSLRAADGVHCSRSFSVRPAESPLDELDPTMTYIEKQTLGFPLVHIIDAEADSVGHYRQWSKRPDRFFLVRADDRYVEWEGSERKCSVVREELRRKGRFSRSRSVLYHGQQAEQWVAEVPVRLLRAATPNRTQNATASSRVPIPGPPVALRLVIVEVRDVTGKVLAIWYLLTNVPPDTDAETIALWYYWRWSIENFHKLIKSAGMQVEEWQQTTAGAIARRLLIASMACVTVWRLARSTHPQAEEAQKLLVRLSGRQMKYGRTYTVPALLAGMWTLLTMLQVLETHTVEELQTLAGLIFPPAQPP